MEVWQRKIIKENKPKLIGLIEGNVSVLAALESKGLISEIEANKLKRIHTNQGRYTQADELLDLLVRKDTILVDKTGNTMSAFDFLIQTLDKETQSGAVTLLQKEKKAYLASVSGAPQRMESE